jgi:hypothetical protein
VIIAAPRR